jgi:hypothetical protein
MKLRRSLYARPVIIRGQQCAEAPLDPGGATKQLPARRYLALEGGLTAEPAWAAERRRRRPQEHGWASQRAVGRRGGPGGPDAGRGFVSLSTSSASVRCPVSGASGRCPGLPVHGTAVRCPVRASERPGVRRPASGVGVRCLCVARPLCPADVRSWSAAVGQAAVWPVSAWSPAASMPGSSSACVGASCSKLAQVVLGQPRRRCGPGRRRGGGWAVASSTAWPTRRGRVQARIVRWWEPVGSELASCGRLIGMGRANRSAGLARESPTSRSQ